MTDILSINISDNMTSPTFIFIDGSYYCFYRYFALNQWWKNAYPDEQLDNPYENVKFLDKFKKTFVENIVKMPKKLKINKNINPILIVGKDCKRENIWRVPLFPQYKSNRVKDDSFMGGQFFKMVYEDKLFEQAGVKAILKHPQLEADDCIALSVKHLTVKYPDCNIYIITSDKDYLQLNADNVNLYNLSFKNIAETKTSHNDPKLDLKIKILMGDNSDNIPSVFPKCGPKTALQCCEDEEYFKKKMNNNDEYYKQYELNKTIIDFDCIPENLVKEFMESLQIKK